MSTAPYSRIFVWIAFALSSVTVVSVSMAVAALIQDPFLMVLFAGAGALLDLAKYMSWPLAAHLLDEGRWPLAAALMACALTMAGVSGWATFDRFMAGMLDSHGEAAAIQHRIDDLESSKERELVRLTTLDENERATQGQLFALRDQVVVRATVEVERVSMRRLDEQRAKAKAELESISRELAELRSKQVTTATLPVELATLLCLLAAAVLELVPALLLAAVRGVAGQKQPDNAPETQPETTETQPATAATGDNTLLQTLLRSVAQTEPGTPVVLREFARAERIGNARATQAFRAAVELGALQRTETGGYVAAATGLIQGAA